MKKLSLAQPAASSCSPWRSFEAREVPPSGRCSASLCRQSAGVCSAMAESAFVVFAVIEPCKQSLRTWACSDARKMALSLLRAMEPNVWIPHQCHSWQSRFCIVMSPGLSVWQGVAPLPLCLHLQHLFAQAAVEMCSWLHQHK